MVIRKWTGPDGREVDVGDKDEVGKIIRQMQGESKVVGFIAVNE